MTKTTTKRGRPATVGPDTAPLAIRLPFDVLDQLDRYAEVMASRTPGIRYTRSDAVRHLIAVGLARDPVAKPTDAKPTEVTVKALDALLAAQHEPRRPMPETKPTEAEPTVKALDEPRRRSRLDDTPARPHRASRMEIAEIANAKKETRRGA